jgi:cation diffusion facilitator family transporter
MVDAKRHYQQIQKVLLIVLILNWLVAAAKMIFGIISRSASMTADGFHSLADGTSNVIGLIGIYYCSQPVDEDHPYGHKKYETLFALGIAAMLLIVAFNLGKQGIFRFIHPVSPKIDVVSFAVMLITIAVNFTVMIYEYRCGKRLGSDILVVDSMHTKSDIFTSISVLAALIGIKLGFPIVDPIVAILISIFIARSAFVIIKEESGILCDACAITETKKIEDIVLTIDGVSRCHKIRTRGRMDDVHLDLHVQIDGNITLNESHKLSHKIQAEIIKALPQITDVLVHLEPNAK